MRTLLLLSVVAAATAAVEPRLPSLKDATVQAVAGMPGFIALSEPHQVRGVDALLLPVSRILWIEDRTVPKGTREERIVTLVVEAIQPLTLVFDDSTAAKPAEVLAAIATAQGR